ncbi:MAG: type 2 isopentenyl-diphosphate Delta-isomerase [archaeon]
MTGWDNDGMARRKADHVDVYLKKDVDYRKSAGFDSYEFIHNALPDIDFRSISTSTVFMGKEISLPILISGMTGGQKDAVRINRNLALAAERMRVALGVGSQRIAIRSRSAGKTFEVRHVAPSIPIIGNLGAAQLNKGFGVDECRNAVEAIKADGLAIHLNPLQEVIQGGDTDFQGILDRIQVITESLGYPVMVKEVGFGVSEDVGKRLEKAGVYAIDVAGAGGTSWSAVESHLATKERRVLGRLFREWGIPTAACIIMNQERGCVLIAGGGIRSGLDMAKAIALGADMVSVAGPLLRAALRSADAVENMLRRLELELRTAMFGIGAATIEDLKGNDALIRVSDWSLP